MQRERTINALTVDQVAQYLRVQPVEIRRLATQGVLIETPINVYRTSVGEKKGGIWLFDALDLEILQHRRIGRRRLPYRKGAAVDKPRLEVIALVKDEWKGEKADDERSKAGVTSG